MSQSFCFDTPTGPFRVTEDDGKLVAASWGSAPRETCSPLLREAKAQIQRYFAGTLTTFDLPNKVTGSPFQQAVCAEIAAIPFGETKTYKDLALALEAPPQAVGQACGGNPLPLLIPCHRIMSSTGLGGFSGGQGIETKVWLLKHEGAGGLLI